MKTCSEKALEWNVTPRTVNAMCKNGRIQGAVKEKRTWLIPDDAEKPLDGRISTGKYSRKKTGKEKENTKDYNNNINSIICNLFYYSTWIYNYFKKTWL